MCEHPDPDGALTPRAADRWAGPSASPPAGTGHAAPAGAPAEVLGRSHTNTLDRLVRAACGPLSVLEPALSLAHGLETETDRALRIVDLTARGFLVLAAIHRDAPRTQRALARRLGLEPSTTNELLGRLARRRLVRRAPRPELTTRGVETLARAARIVAKLEREWAERLRARRGGSAVPGWPGPVYGLRRWLCESGEALGAAAPGGVAPGVAARGVAARGPAARGAGG